jgi:hypothetical protein
VKIVLRNARTQSSAEIEILLPLGPLSIAGAWDWGRERRAPGLFRIYHTQSGLPIGPYYAEMTLAEKGARKALSLGEAFWKEKASWYANQKWLRDWLDKNLGKPEYLIGGQWAKE